MAKQSKKRKQLFADVCGYMDNTRFEPSRRHTLINHVWDFLSKNSHAQGEIARRFREFGEKALEDSTKDYKNYIPDGLLTAPQKKKKECDGSLRRPHRTSDQHAATSGDRTLVLPKTPKQPIANKFVATRVDELNNLRKKIEQQSYEITSLKSKHERLEKEKNALKSALTQFSSKLTDFIKNEMVGLDSEGAEDFVHDTMNVLGKMDKSFLEDDQRGSLDAAFTALSEKANELRKAKTSFIKNATQVMDQNIVALNANANALNHFTESKK